MSRCTAKQQNQQILMSSVIALVVILSLVGSLLAALIVGVVGHRAPAIEQVALRCARRLARWLTTESNHDEWQPH